MNTDFILTRRTANDETVLLCPVCGDEYVSPVAVDCRSPGGEKGHVRIDRQGLRLDPTAPAVGRGALVTLRFCCESGHGFGYGFHSHKGNTFVRRETGPQDVPLPLRYPIWRI